MLKTINSKIVFFLIVFVSLANLIIYFFVSNGYEKIINDSTKREAQGLSIAIFKSLRSAMNLGDPVIIEQSVKETKTIPGITDLTVFRAKVIDNDFGFKKRPDPDKNVQKAFEQKKEILQEIYDQKHKLRLIQPLLATKECLACHAVKENDVLGVIDLGISLTEADEIVELSVQKVAISMFIVTVLIISVFVVFFKLEVFAPLDNMGQIATELASTSGDLTKRINFGKGNELGIVSSAIDSFLDKIQETVNAAKKSSSDSVEVGKSLLSISDAIEEMISKQNKKTKQSNELVVKITDKLDESEHSSISTAQELDDTDTALNEITQDLEGVLESVQTASEKETQMSEKIHELNTQAQDIHDIIAAVKDIAEQTNLLSLNASIEAARVGEHGRGFAVVAQEIGKLAQQTQKTLLNVDSTISIILDTIANSSFLMSENAQNMSKIASQADLMHEKLTQTRDMMNTTNDNSHKSVDLVIAIAHETKSLVEIMQETTKLAQENKNNVRHIVDSAHAISNSANTLKKKLEEFKS